MRDGRSGKCFVITNDETVPFEPLFLSRVYEELRIDKGEAS